jgi:hypothetical protein
MGIHFAPYLEYDGKNPDRNDFICCLDDECCYSYIKRWDDLFKLDDLRASSHKEFSSKVEKAAKSGEALWSLTSWGLNKILSRINLMKKEWNLGEDVQYIFEDDENYEDKFKNIGCDYDLLHIINIICDLQLLYYYAMKKCTKLNLNPEKCYVVWWIDY